MFETFDIKSFGKYLRELRLSLSYTQKDIVKLSGISIDSLRRVETGAVLPRYDTLANLSLAYKKDLLDDLKSYRNSNVIFQYYARLDNILLKYDIAALENLKQDFSVFSDNKNDEVFLNRSIKNQFLLLLDGISMLHSKQHKGSIVYFINAISISIPNFNLYLFNRFNYTHFETRILLLIAIALEKEKRIDLSSRILKECLRSCNFSIDATTNEKLMICKLYFQLSYDSHILDNYKDVILYSQKGIDYCNKHNITYLLAGLFYRKGVAEFRLGFDSYLATLNKSIILLLITNNQKLAEIYIQITKDNYGIDINIDDL